MKLSSLIALAATAVFLTACGGGGDTGEDGVISHNGEDTSPPAIPTVDLSALPAPYNAADYDTGRRMFRRCASCHTVTPDGGNRVGPNLYGMFGQVVGTQDGFDYSTALEEADFIWTPEQLDAWLANPREFLPGNRMSFVGLRDEEDRVNVIAYLMHETGYSAD
ncbi:c-type cytochrome [Hyphobacterium sp.]|uniref:c-type cytochrome n=1 Tax=Hyphobacterium sp. TaxID=2004662 RepID=UPI003BAC39B3